METTQIYEKVTELAEAITQSELFMEYKNCQQELLLDETFLALKDDFLKLKDAFEEVSRYGSYHPDLERVRKDYQKAKVELMSHQLFKRFKRIEKELDTMIFEIEEQIQAVVGIENKHKKSALKFMY
jgi:cell fate (sporulation/competence/biofilm development) regulator YlbF (YheA/YmcA/DUF963 family)